MREAPASPKQWKKSNESFSNFRHIFRFLQLPDPFGICIVTLALRNRWNDSSVEIKSKRWSPEQFQNCYSVPSGNVRFRRNSFRETREWPTTWLRGWWSVLRKSWLSQNALYFLPSRIYGPSRIRSRIDRLKKKGRKTNAPLFFNKFAFSKESLFWYLRLVTPEIGIVRSSLCIRRPILVKKNKENNKNNEPPFPSRRNDF